MAQTACAAAAAPASGQAIASMQYGEIVFHYYQGDDLAAITQWMMAQPLQRSVAAHHEAELLHSDLLMRYGMDREAGEILARLPERGGHAQSRDQAWFKLAKWRYQRGQLLSAEEALARGQGLLSAPQEDARSLLKAQLLMARADYRGAAQVLKALADKTPEAWLARYNLGVAQIKAGDAAGGMATLDALGNEPADTDEQRMLRDRANVTLGFAALKAQQPAAARRYLERVPLQGGESSKALLGYGWAAMDQQAPQSALVPWLALIKRDASDVAVLEARIAVPYAYEQLGAKAKALQYYAEAIELFERQRRSLDASMDFVRSGRLVEALSAHNPPGPFGQEGDLILPSGVPHMAPLASLLAQHAFQQAFRNLNELRSLGAELQRWPAKIGLFKDTLATGRQAFVKYQGRFSALDGAKRMAALRQRVDAIAGDVAQGESRMDGMAFADGREREWLTRLASLQAKTPKPGRNPEATQIRDRTRLLAGVLNWELAQQAPPRLLQAKQDLASTNEDLAEAQRGDAVIAQAMREVSQRLDRFDTRVQAVADQLEQTRSQVAALQSEQQAALQDMALAELARQKEGLSAYQAQARFAVAKLYDQAAATGKPDSARSSSSTGNTEAADAPKQ